MEKSALITEEINIQLEDARKEPRRFMNQKKREKAFAWKPNIQPMKMPDRVQSDNGGKAKPLLLATQCSQELKKNVYLETGALKFTFSPAQHLTTCMTT